MLTHKGECLQQREQILQKKKKKKRSLRFSFLYICSCLSARKGNMLLQDVVALCSGTSLQVSQFFHWTIADTCGRVFFLRVKQTCIQAATKTLKTYKITTVLIKMNISSNLSDSELSIDIAL